ncbi:MULTISPECIES: TetR family transcriptional regulator [unclassified Corynebacterium]|uniref:TetR/AcrR family transcriptional regulator n=1 Tax=unclassified Corynebacterium TaxID=2624378 RepID=UPI003526AA92
MEKSSARNRILASASALFAARGYRGTTLRAVATGAGCDVALVPHYFGNKEGLFRAVIQFPADPGDIHAVLASVPFDDLGPVLVKEIIALWESPVADQLLAMARGALEDPAPFSEYLTSVLWEPVRARLKENGVDRAEAERRIAFSQSQLAGIIVTRYLFRLPAARELSTADLVKSLGPVVQGFLDGN